MFLGFAERRTKAAIYSRKRILNIKKIKIIGIVLVLFLTVGLTIFMILRNRESFTGSRIKNSDFYALDITRMNGTDTHTLELLAGDISVYNLKPKRVQSK